MLSYRRQIKIKIVTKIFGLILVLIFFIFLTKTKINFPVEIKSLNYEYLPFEIETKKFFQQKNILTILTLKKMGERLLSQFPSIRKINLNFNLKKIKITYEVFEPLAKICNNFCAFVSKEGIIFPEIYTSNLPIIYSKIDFSYGQKLNQTYLEILKKIKENNIEFEAFIILENGDIKISNNLTILFDPLQNIDNQFIKLKIILEKVPSLKYVDLRIPGRIFFY